MSAAASLAPAAYTPDVVVRSDVLGAVTVSPAELIHFPAGVCGFPECRSFVLVSTARAGVFWLQSCEYGPLALLLVDPFLFFPGYVAELAPAERATLGSTDPSSVAILCVVTLPRERGEPCTANLDAPVAVDLGRRCGVQIVPGAARFDARSPIDLAAADL